MWKNDRSPRRWPRSAARGLGLAIVCLLIASAGAPLRAKEAQALRDPFFASGPRSTVTTTGTTPNDADAGFGRDPFNKPAEVSGAAASGAATPAGNQLTGIIYGKNVRIAIIGGELLGVGSRVGDRRIVEIRRRSIILMGRGGDRQEIVLENFTLGK